MIFLPESVFIRRKSEMLVSEIGHRSPLRGSVQQSQLDEIRFVNVLDRHAFLSYSSSNSINSNRSSVESFYDQLQDIPVSTFKAQLVHTQSFKCPLCDGRVYASQAFRPTSLS